MSSVRALLSTSLIAVGSASLEARAQSNEELARFQYEEAVRQQKAGQPAECVTALRAAQAKLGRAALRIQGLLVQCLFEAGDMSAVVAESKVYFGLAPDPSLAEYQKIGAWRVQAERAQDQAATARRGQLDARLAGAAVQLAPPQNRVVRVDQEGGYRSTYTRDGMVSASVPKPCVVKLAGRLTTAVRYSDGESPDIEERSRSCDFGLEGKSLKLEVGKGQHENLTLWHVGVTGSKERTSCQVAGSADVAAAPPGPLQPSRELQIFLYGTSEAGARELAAALAALDEACAAPVAPDGRPTEAPPAEKLEQARPRAGFVWLGGHWDWRGGTWRWVDGHWERSRPDSTWRPGRWTRQGERYQWEAGSWMKK